MTFPRARAGLVRLLTTTVVLGSCASLRPPAAQVQPDGTYRLACDKPLAECLAPFDKCHNGFDVVRANETRQRRGPEPLPTETVTSEVVVRCRQMRALFGSPETDAAASSDKAPSTTACFPGSTHACLGPGACNGAQVCQADGAAFGPCDCGRAHAPSAPASGAATPADGGAPPVQSGDASTNP